MMCNKLRILLSTMEESDKPMTKSEVLSVLKVCGEDMEKHTKKIENLENKVEEIQETQKTILNMQNSMFDMLKTSLSQQKDLQDKLYKDKIEEKAFAYDQNQKIFRNWKVWVALVGIIAFAGMGVLKLLDKSDNIATISKAIK